MTVTALQTVIAALQARVHDAVDPALAAQLQAAVDQHAAEQAELQALRDSYAALVARVDAISVPDLGPLESRVDALEARNAEDDAAAAELASEPAPAPAPAPAPEPAPVETQPAEAAPTEDAPADPAA